MHKKKNNKVGVKTARREENYPKNFFFFLDRLYGRWDLSFQTRDRTVPLALEVWSPNYWMGFQGNALKYYFYFSRILPRVVL